MASTVVLRDASGGINAGAVKATGIITGNGSGLTALNASQMTNGTLALGQLPGGVVTNNETGVVLSGAFSGNGSGLTNFNGTNANLGSTLVKRDASGSFTNRNLSLDGNLNLPLTTATNGIIFSGGIPLLHSYGNSNFFAGYGAGNLTMSGSHNLGIGIGALGNNTGGSGNSASGEQALYSNTNGNNNIALGHQAGYNNVSGTGNIDIGNPGGRPTATSSALVRARRRHIWWARSMPTAWR